QHRNTSRASHPLIKVEYIHQNMNQSAPSQPTQVNQNLQVPSRKPIHKVKQQPTTRKPPGNQPNNSASADGKPAA
ncbi:hypothetical protein, partial [Humitalea rosea]|uniref:hypothetical protein n=1 Tax=Humitalea rosea TaxID=990373 RepID=UPI001B875B99